MACKWPVVKRISVKAVRDTDRLEKINFRTEKKLKDIGYFLLAGLIFDLVGLPANLSFLLRLTQG